MAREQKEKVIRTENEEKTTPNYENDLMVSFASDPNMDILYKDNNGIHAL